MERKVVGSKSGVEKVVRDRGAGNGREEGLKRSEEAFEMEE